MTGQTFVKLLTKLAEWNPKAQQGGRQFNGYVQLYLVSQSKVSSRKPVQTGKQVNR